MASQQENPPPGQQEATSANTLPNGNINGDHINDLVSSVRRGMRCSFCGMRGHGRVDCFFSNYLAFGNNLRVALSRRSPGGGIQQNDYLTLDAIHRRLEEQIPNTADMRETLVYSREYLDSLLGPGQRPTDQAQNNQGQGNGGTQ